MGRLQDRLDERAAGVGVAEPPTTPVRKVFAASTVGGRLQRRLNERAAGPKPTPAQPVPAPAQPVPTTIPKPVVQPIPEQPSRPEPSPKQEIVGELMGFPVYAEREELTKQKEAAEAEAIAGQTEVARKYIDAGVDYMLSPRQLSTVAGGVLERERLSPTAQAMGKVYDESYWAVRESYSQQAINEGASASEANQWADTQMASADSQQAVKETAEANMPELVNLMRQGAAPDLEGFGGSLKQLGIMAKYWGQFATLPLNRTLGALSNGLARVTGGEEIPLPTKEGLWMRREIDKGTLDTQMAAKILNAAGGDQKVAKEIVAVALSRAEGFDDAEMEYLLEAGVDNVLNTAGWIFELWAGGEIAGTVTGANKLATAARTSPELVPKALKAAHRARALFASMIGLDTYSQLRTDGANRKDAAMSAALITAVYYGLGEGLARGPGALAQFKGWRAERADYRILGLRKGATPKEVKVAVKALRIRLEPVINRVDVSPKVRQAAEQELFRAIKAADSITKRIWARVSAQAGVTPAPAARRMLPGAREAQAPPTEGVPVAARPAAPVRPPTGITPTAAVVKPPAPPKPPTPAPAPQAAEAKPAPAKQAAPAPEAPPAKPVAAEAVAKAVKPRTPLQVRRDELRASKQAKGLEAEVIAQYEADTGESIETIRERAIGGVPTIEGEPVPVEGFTGEFAGPLPGEVTDHLKGMSFGKRMRYQGIIKGNVPGGEAEDFVGDLPGGYSEFFERATLIVEGRKGGLARGIAEARRWGMDTRQYEMAAKAEAAEQLRSTKEPIADIDAFVAERAAELEGRPVPQWAAESQAGAVAEAVTEAQALPETRTELNKLVRAGRLELSATLKDMRAIVDMLPVSQRHKAIAALSNITGPKAGVKAFVRRINRILDAQQAREVRVGAMKKYKEAVRGIRAGGRLRPEFQAKYDALVDSFTEHTHTDRILNRLNAVVRASEGYRTEAMADTEAVDIPYPKIVERAKGILTEQGKVPLRKLTPDAVRQVADAITHLGRLNELKNHLLIGGHFRDLSKIASASAEDVRKGRQTVVDMTTIKSEDKPEAGGVAGWSKRLWLRNHRLETLAAKMTRVDSPAVDILAKELIYKATNDEINIQHASLEGLQEALKAKGFALDPKFLRGFSPAYARAEAGFFKRSLTVLARRKLENSATPRLIKLPRATYAEALEGGGWRPGEPVGELALAPAHIADLLGHFWAPDNLSSIVSGTPVYLEWKGRYAKPILLTWPDVRAIEAAATDAERAVRDYIVEDCNTHLKDAVNKTSVEWAGFDLLRVDRWYSRARAMQFEPKGAPAESLQYWTEKTLEGQGWTKERIGGRRPIIVRDALDRYLSHLSGGSRYAAWLGPLRNARVLLNEPTFAKAVSRHYGSTYLRLFRAAYQILEDPGFGKGGPGAETMSMFIGNMYKGILGFRPHIAGYQFLSYGFIARELPARDVAAGLNLAHKANFAKLREHSGILYQRFGGVGGTRTAIIGPAAGGARLKTMLTPRKGEAVMSWISGADRKTLGRISVAVESYIRRMQPELKGDDFWKAVATKTEEMVVHNQPSFTAASRSLLALDAKSGDVFAKVFTLFSSVRESIVNQWIMDDLTYRDGPKNAGARAKLLRNKLILLTNFAFIAMIGDLWYRAVKGFPKDKEPWASRIVRAAVSRALGTVFFFGDIASAAWDASYATWKGLPIWKTGIRDNPLSEAVDDGITGIVEMEKGIKKQIQGKKARERLEPKEHYWRGIEKLGRAAGVLFGLPIIGTTEIARLVKTGLKEEAVEKEKAKTRKRKNW